MADDRGERLARVLRDFADEHAVLDGMVARIGDSAWDTPTPAEGWTVADQVNHLAFFDDRARIAVTDPEAFAAQVERDFGDVQHLDEHLDAGRELTPAQLLDWSRRASAAVLAALETVDPFARVPWYGPPMSTTSFVTARLMETWAHGRDVADALGVSVPGTSRLRHIADLGVRTHGWTYSVRGRDQPSSAVRVELSAPDGEHWTWGPADAPDRVEGPAEDFCLVVTQRRNVADTDLVCSGADAREWMEIAQAYAGPAGEGRQPAT